MTATADVGEPVSVSLPVSVATDPVAYPRELDAACPERLTVPGRFADVTPGSPHTAMIDCLATRGLVRGRSSAACNLVADVSRAQMASFLVRLLEEAGIELPEDVEDAFDDDDGNTHEEAIDQLAAAGLLTGTGDGEVGPNDSLTREHGVLLGPCVRGASRRGVERPAGLLRRRRRVRTRGGDQPRRRDRDRQRAAGARLDGTPRPRDVPRVEERAMPNAARLLPPNQPV